MRDAAIFDMDGTLQDISSVRHHVARPGRKNFHRFHAEAVDCPPHWWVVDLARQASVDGLDVLIVTARMAMWKYTTLWPLWHWGVPVDALFMRANGDSRKDFVVKGDILREIRRRWTVHFAVDDNPAVWDVWCAADIPVIEVPGWDGGLQPSIPGDTVPALVK